MSREITGALQELAREFYRGELQLAEYRLKRRNLLSMLFGIEANTATRPQAARKQQPAPEKIETSAPTAAPQKRPVETGTAPAADIVTRSDAAPAPRKVKRRLFLPFAVIAAGIVVALGISFWITGREIAPPTVKPVIVDESPDAAAHGLVENFLDENIWDDQRLDELSENWGNLTPDQRAAARGAQWLTAFQRDLKDLIDEQRAVGPLADNDSAVSLARALGIRVRVDSATQPTQDKVPVPDVESTPASVKSTPPPPPATVPDGDGETQDSSPDILPATKTTITPPVVTAAADTVSDATADEPQSDDVASLVSADPIVPSQSAPVAVRAPDKRACHEGLLRTRSPTCRDTLADGNNGPRLAVIPAGEFLMGSKWAAEEKPIHTVVVTAPFAIGQYEVSHADYALFCKTGRDCPASPWGGAEFPVVNVSWDDATAYLAWLSDQTGQRYRLPTEAEWEYAARAGHDTRYPFGDELAAADARFAADSPLANDDRRVNSNDFRLFHVVGNAREWVQDHWVGDYTGAPGDARARTGSGTERVVRGGCYADEDALVRSAVRLPLSSTTRDICTGFRVVRELEP